MFFVIYDHGIEKFEDEDEALEFINQRLANHLEATDQNYILIEGFLHKLKAAERVTRLEIDR